MYSRFQNDRHPQLFFTLVGFLSVSVLRGMRQPLRGCNFPQEVIRWCFFCARSPDRAYRYENGCNTQYLSATFCHTHDLGAHFPFTYDSFHVYVSVICSAKPMGAYSLREEEEMKREAI